MVKISYHKIYEHGFNRYRLENILRNSSLILALYNSAAHQIIWIAIFFILGLIAQLHPFMYLYVKTHATNGFYRYLQRKINRYDQKQTQFKTINQKNSNQEIKITIDSETNWQRIELKYMHLIQKTI